MSKEMSLRKVNWIDASEDEKIIKMKELLYRKVVRKHTGCWDFTGSINKWGYGEMHIGGRFNPSHHNAHRISWIVHRGNIPKGLIVCHVCDCRSCCNPEHLFLGTHKDNMQDMIKKGRSNFLKGDKCPWAILTEKKVLEILKMFEKGFNAVEIGKKFNIDRRHISDIKRGRRWGHVGDRSKIKQIAPNKIVLNKEKVLEIKKMFKLGLRIVDICKHFNVNSSIISDIKHGKTWKHVNI